MADMLGIGISGLIAYQRALQVVSHNVANANTEGYNRQRLELGTQIPLFQGGGYIGNGVLMKDVERVYDGFLTDQVRVYTSSTSHAEVYANYAGVIDGMLADPDIGLGPAMNDFFSELQAVANDPASLPARQSFLTQAETLADRFGYINRRFEDIRSQLNDHTKNYVTDINGLANQIAALNRDIVLAPGNNPPNDLLDQRDQLLTQLASKISVSTVEQDNGAINVFFGKGQMLVMNFDVNQLMVTRNEYDVRQYEVSVESGLGPIKVTSQVAGGQLGAIFDFRNQVLDKVQDSIGAMAIGFADSFNVQHRLGQDLNGNLGMDFFNVPALEAISNGNNTGNGTVSATLTDVSQLTGDEYELSYSLATGYNLRRLSDNSITNFAALPATTSYGFTLDLASGVINDGDKFMIRPGRLGAEDLSVAITSASEIAAAAPVRTAADILNNAGSGTISLGVVTDTSNLQASPLPPLSSDIVMEYDGTNINVISGPAPWNGMSFVYNNGAEVTTLSGFSFTISGALAVGDRFSIESNTNGVGDNRNALLMSDLQNQKMLTNGTASYLDYYGIVVADAGILTKQSHLTLSSQNNLLEQAMNSRDALSGVNLDEEAANLVKYQQAYQAASQVIVVANNMFQSLLNALRG